MPQTGCTAVFTSSSGGFRLNYSGSAGGTRSGESPRAGAVAGSIGSGPAGCAGRRVRHGARDFPGCAAPRPAFVESVDLGRHRAAARGAPPRQLRDLVGSGPDRLSRARGGCGPASSGIGSRSTEGAPAPCRGDADGDPRRTSRRRQRGRPRRRPPTGWPGAIPSSPARQTLTRDQAHRRGPRRDPRLRPRHRRRGDLPRRELPRDSFFFFGVTALRLIAVAPRRAHRPVRAGGGPRG